MSLDWQTLGARTVVPPESSPPVDLSRLISRPPAALALPRAASPRAEVRRRLRFLVTTDSQQSEDDVLAALKPVLAPRAVATAGSVAAGIVVRPLGRVTPAGTRCFLVELPIGLGDVLADVDYDVTALHGLAEVLADQPGILAAEPDLPARDRVRPQQEFLPGCTAGRAAAPDDVAWAPRLMGLFELPAARPTGLGVRLGHIDTGFTRHPELDVSAHFDLPACTTTIGQLGGDGTDPMPGGTSHGTATISAVTSAPGGSAVDDRGRPSAGITGLAPAAKIVSVRGVEQVVQIEPFWASDIVEAVWHCILADCHVITMSFGGLLSPATRAALSAAHDRDIILCAAAGNCVGVVVEPACLDDVVACAAVGLGVSGNVHPWTGTSHGPAVDVCAPGENVWIADYVDGAARVRPGEGTSFAASATAAAATLWLQHHGRAALLTRYGPQGIRLGDAFRRAVRASARRPAGWNLAVGPGVLHLPSLLAAPLPTAQQVRALAPKPQLLEQISAALPGPFTGTPAVDRVVVELTEVKVRDDGEALGGAEPYLMVVGILVDGTTARAELTLSAADLLNGQNPVRLRLRPRGSLTSFVRVRARGGHGSLDQVNIGPIELALNGPVSLRPSDSVRQWTTDVQPIPLTVGTDLNGVSADLGGLHLPGFVGAVALLSEEDLTAQHEIREARTAVAEGVRDLLEDILSEITLADLSADPASFPEQIQAIEDAARRRAATSMNLWEAFWGGVVDPDDQLLHTFSFVNVAQLGDPARIAGAYQGEHGNWTLTGTIRRA